MRLAEKLKSDYENLLIRKGEEYFYRYAVGSGFMDRVDYQYPEMLMLEKAEAFFSLFRQSGNENYFTIGRILRRAAHRLYRNRIRSGELEFNSRFLNIVK